MSNITEEIKARLDVVDLIKEYIPLLPAGVNFKAKCPFHNEKTPSFFVSPEKQIWHCFGCGAGGDIFEFIKKIEGIEFPEALRILADKANVKIDYNYNPDLQNQKTKVLDILEATVSYFYNLLLKSKNAKIARDYLKERSINEKAINLFSLGYSNDSWDDLLNFLKKKKFSDRDIEAAGLITKSGKDNKFYDRFRGRLMFPINNVFGQTIGFTARILKKDDLRQGKYINTPRTIVYDKSNVLYNMDLAKMAIKKKNYTILVEGQIDVISSYMAGIKNVIASSGTALTPQQVKILKRYSENLIIAYDADKAGIKATFRIIDNALAESMNIKIIGLPKGLDPDQLIKKDKKKWIDAIKNASPIMGFVFDKVLSTGDLNNVFHKKQIAKKLLVFISKFRDEIERETYLKRLSDLIDVDYGLLKNKLEQFILKKRAGIKDSLKKDEYIPSQIDRKKELLKKIIALSINFPENLEYLSSNLELEYINNSDIDELYKEIIIYYTKNNSLDLKCFKKSLSKEQNDLLNVIIFIFENEYSEYDKNKAFVEIQPLIIVYKKEFLSDKLKKLEHSLKEAERKGAKARVEKIMKKFISYTHKLKNIKII